MELKAHTILQAVILLILRVKKACDRRDWSARLSLRTPHIVIDTTALHKNRIDSVFPTKLCPTKQQCTAVLGKLSSGSRRFNQQNITYYVRTFVDARPSQASLARGSAPSRRESKGGMSPNKALHAVAASLNASVSRRREPSPRSPKKNLQANHSWGANRWERSTGQKKKPFRRKDYSR